MVFGVTGAIGSGKSSLMKLFSQAGFFCFDADAVCKELLTTQVVTDKCVEKWGVKILDDKGQLSRPAIADIVFTDSTQLDYLTSILYPELEKRLLFSIEECKKNNINGAFELPLLYECGFEKYFDKIVCIYTSKSIRHKRLEQKRNISNNEAARREAKQLSAEIKLEKADYAIINNGTEEELLRQFNLVFK